MKALKNTFFIKAEREVKDKLIVAGRELFLDTDFDPYRHAVQDGIIEITPHRITPKKIVDGIESGFYYDNTLIEGDKVYFHHFIVQKDNKFKIKGETLYKCEYEQIYCVIREGQVIPLEEFFFSVPIMEEESNYKTKSGIWLKPEAEVLKDHAKVTHVSKQCAKAGLKVGDVIIHKPSANYDIKIEGVDCFRMKLRSIAVIIRDGEPVPVKDMIVIEEDKQENEMVGNIEVVVIKKKRQIYGTVLSRGAQTNLASFNLDKLTFEEFDIGDRVLYNRGECAYVHHDNKLYGLLNQEGVLGFTRSQRSISKA